LSGRRGGLRRRQTRALTHLSRSVSRAGKSRTGDAGTQAAPWLRRRLRAAWEDAEHRSALAALEALARQLDGAHHGAAGSLREGLAETLTVTRLGLRGRLKATPASTNPCESMIEIVRRTQRNVKRWRSGEMRLRWTAAGMLEAEKQFRRIRGHRELPILLAALHREVDPAEDTDTVRAV
jgi:putative transposase